MIDSTPRFFLIDKPKGITSFDVIRRLKPYFFELYGKGKGRNKLKVGHFGTLDPFAEGLLLVGVGKSLRLTELVHKHLSKEYEAIGIVGQRSLTGDCDGDIIETKETIPATELIKESLKSFVGEYHQRPSYFSAVKHEGKPLYEYARQGIFIDKDPVLRTIYHCELMDRATENNVQFKVTVSTGTYIRKLWEDCCEKIGNIGYLNALRRTAIGHLKVESATPLESIESASQLKAYDPQDVLSFKQVFINDDVKDFLIHGRDVELAEEEEWLWLMHENCGLVALGKRQKDGTYRSHINFVNAS